MIRTTQKKPVDKERLSQIISKFEKKENKVSLLDEIGKKMEILEQKSAQKLKEKPIPPFEPNKLLNKLLIQDDDDDVNIGTIGTIGTIGNISKPKKTKTTKKVVVKETPKIHIEKHDSLFIPEDNKIKSSSFISAIAETQKKNVTHYVPQESVPDVNSVREPVKDQKDQKDQIEINPNVYDLIIPDELRAQGLNAIIVKNNPKIYNELKTKYISKKRQDEYERKQQEAKQKLELEKQLYEERTKRKELEYQQYVWYKTLQERNQQPTKPSLPPIQKPQFQEPREQQRPQFQEPQEQQRPQFQEPREQQRPQFQEPREQQRPQFQEPREQQRPQNTKLNFKKTNVQIIKEGSELQQPTQPINNNKEKIEEFKIYVSDLVRKTSKKYNVPVDAMNKIVCRVNALGSICDIKNLVNKFKAFILSYTKTQKAKELAAPVPPKQPLKKTLPLIQIVYKTRKQCKNPNWEKKQMKETYNIKQNKSYRNYMSTNRITDKELRVSPRLNYPYTNPEMKSIDDIMDKLESKKIISIHDRFKKVPQDIYEWLYKITADGTVKIIH
jgi:hypothetical protein